MARSSRPALASVGTAASATSVAAIRASSFFIVGSEALAFIMGSSCRSRTGADVPAGTRRENPRAPFKKNAGTRPAVSGGRGGGAGRASVTGNRNGLADGGEVGAAAERLVALARSYISVVLGDLGRAFDDGGV